MPVLSKGELEINDGLKDYFAKHIDRIMDDSNIKKAEFTGPENNILSLCKMLNERETDFLSITSEMANSLFALMQKHIDIPSADLVCCLVEVNGQKHIGILKLNYKTGFTHWVDNASEGGINTIIRYQTLLPQEGQKIDECILINLIDYSICVIEKQYEINGEKEYYLTKYYLQCNCDLSNNAKLKILDKVAKDINKKYFDEDFEKAIKLKKAVADSLEEKEAIHIEHIAERIYDKNIEVKNEYMEEIKKAGLCENEITLSDKLVEKKFRIQKIKTDTGIEINFPLEYADKQDKIEFVNNSDGTIAIIIKNIGKIVNR
jgi:hypothetical protein